MLIPKPLVGMPGLSGIGESESIEDNPITDKQAERGHKAWLGHRLADLSLALCILGFVTHL